MPQLPKPLLQLTTAQANALEAVRVILRDHWRCSRCHVFDLLPWPVAWKRVTWTGGVGSWKLMRGGRLRIQVAASCSGYSRARQGARISAGGSLIVRASKGRRIGWKYAWCVEIRPDLLDFPDFRYLCGAGGSNDPSGDEAEPGRVGRPRGPDRRHRPGLGAYSTGQSADP